MKENSKRIIYYTGSLASGGAERQLIYTALAAKRRGYDVIIVIDYPINHYEEMLENEGVNVYCTRTTKRTPFKRFFKLMKITKEFSPYIFHSFLSTKNIWGMLVAKIRKVPIRIASIRNTDKNSFKGIKMYEKWATKIVCNSKLAREIACKRYGISQEKLQVIYNAIDIRRFSNIDNKKSIRKELNLSSEIVLGVTVARIAKQKNHINLVKALAKLNGEGKLENVHYLLVGNKCDDNLFDELQYEIKKNNLKDKITYLGVRSDIPEILNECDFMVLPSLYEGFPNVVMEAMASKTFVIAANVGGVPELIENDFNGYLIDEPTPKEISLSIQRYIESEKSKKEAIIENAFNTIQSFTSDKIFDKVLQIYEEQRTSLTK